MGTESRPREWRGIDLTDPTVGDRPVAPDHATAGDGTVGTILHADDLDRFVASLRRGREHRQDTIVRVHHDDGRWIEVRCSFIPVGDDEPHRPIAGL